MNIIFVGILILTFLILSVKAQPVWVLLDDDLKPIIQNQPININLGNNNYIHYQSIYNLSITNIGYTQIRIMIDIKLMQEIPKMNENHLKGLFYQTNFSQILCASLANDNINFICGLEQIPKQQNFIEIVIQLSLKYLIRNLQVYILKCTQNCEICQLLTKNCLKCEDQYQNFFNQCLKIDDGNNNIIDFNFQYNYLENKYKSQLQFERKKKLLTISNGDVNNIILDYNTTNTTKEIMIDNKIQTGPFIQNEGLEYSNFNINILEPIDIRIDFTIYILYNEYILNILCYSINGFELQKYIPYRVLDELEDCQSPLYLKCKIYKFDHMYYNVTKIDTFKIQGRFTLQQNPAWALGNIQITQLQLLNCQNKIHQSNCLKQCPLGTIDDNNVCQDKIKEKYIDLQYFNYTSNLEFLQNNRFYIEFSEIYFKYENSTYELVNRNIERDIKITKTIEIYFKLIIVDANIDEQIIIKLANYSLTFNVSNMKPLTTSIGVEELLDYAFELQNNHFEFEHAREISKLHIIRKGCTFIHCKILISELLIVSSKCIYNCEKCTQELGCIVPIQQSMYCQQNYYYVNFECRECSKKCVKCNQMGQCLECEEGFVLFSGECYYRNKLKYYTQYDLNIQLKDPTNIQQWMFTTCDDQYQVRNVDYCYCQDGSILNQEQNCIPCGEQCLTCIQTINHCQSCRSTEYRKLESGQCVCQEGYYEQGGNLYCQKCQSKCKQCQYKEFICTECYLSQHRVLNLNDCICQDGYYHDFINDICLQCNTTCKNCKDYETCIACDELQFRILTFQNQCICKQGYYQKNEICESCHYTCLECNYSSEFNKCTKCTQERKRKHLQMDYFECVCQDGYYDIGNQLCYDCQLLDNPPINHYCYAKCGDGIIQWNEECDNGIQIQRDGCHQCKLSQSKCQTEICQICYQKECVQCQDGYYIKNDYSCDKCSPICKTCKINPYNCIICAENNNQCSNCLPDKGYIYLDNSCQSICGDGYITLEEECDDGNLLDNDGCNSNCLIEHLFVCGNTCAYKPSLHFLIKQNKFDKYYSNQRHFHIIIKNYESNIEKEQLQLFYVNTKHQFTSDCGKLNYTINKQSISQIDYQQFIIKLHLYQSCIDQYLNIMLFNDSTIIYEKQIQLINYFTLQYQFIIVYDYLLQSFNLLLQFYTIIFIINFIFVQSNKYIEILFLFQMIAYQKHFEILKPKYFETFVELFSPYLMILFQKLDIQNDEQFQQEIKQSQVQDNIVRQLIYIIILILISSTLRLIIYILIRISQNRPHQFNKKLIQKLQKQLSYQLSYFLNYFNYQLYVWITLNQYNIQILIYFVFVIICHFKIQKYYRKQKQIRIIVLLNTTYIFILMIMIKNQIFQLLLTSLIVGIQLILIIIEKNYFQLKYKLLLVHLWGTHFLYLIFELYTSSIQKYEQLNQILGGVLVLNYFIILVLQILDILRNSLMIIKQYYSKFKDRSISTNQKNQHIGINTPPRFQNIQR